MPFDEGTVRKFESITRLHGAVFEMEADNMIGKDSGIDIAETKL